MQTYAFLQSRRLFTMQWKCSKLLKCALVISMPLITVFIVIYDMYLPYHHRTARFVLRPNFTLVSSRDVPAVHVHNVNCTALFSGDAVETQKAINSSSFKTATSADEIIRQARNCSEFVERRRYLTRPVNEEEAAFPLAFSILLYRDVEQFERLLRAVYRPQNIYCVHVDSKSSSAVKDTVKSVVACFENVFMSPRSYDVQWGMFSVLAPELTCMAELLRRHRKWKYFINLTGQEFPLKTNWQIVRILDAFDGANNMEGTVRGRNMNRYAGRWPTPINMTVTKGSVHIIATRGFVDFAVNNETALKFLEWVKKTDIPDETYFSSLNHNPQLGVSGAYRGVPETNDKTNPFLVRFKNWGSSPCHGKFVHSICIFGIGDLPLLISRRELFANKFHADFQPLAYDCMEELYYNRVRSEVLFQNDRFTYFNADEYKHFDFVRNHIN